MLVAIQRWDEAMTPETIGGSHPGARDRQRHRFQPHQAKILPIGDRIFQNRYNVGLGMFIPS